MRPTSYSRYDKNRMITNAADDDEEEEDEEGMDDDDDGMDEEEDEEVAEESSNTSLPTATDECQVTTISMRALLSPSKMNIHAGQYRKRLNIVVVSDPPSSSTTDRLLSLRHDQKQRSILSSICGIPIIAVSSASRHRARGPKWKELARYLMSYGPRQVQGLCPIRNESVNTVSRLMLRLEMHTHSICSSSDSLICRVALSCG